MSDSKGFDFEVRQSDSRFVEKIWRNESGDVETFLSVAAPKWRLVVTKERDRTYVTLRGPETRVTRVRCPENAEFLGIDFKLGAFMPALPASRLRDGEIELPDAGARAFRLDGSAWEIPTFENADSFLARLERTGLIVNDAIVTAALGGEPAPVSDRSVQRHFADTTGLTLRFVRQATRAQRAANLLRGGASILDVVSELGYFDQAHLTHAVKRFIGQTPAQLLRRPTPTGIF